MSILKFLGLRTDDDPAQLDAGAESDIVRRIERELEALPEDKAWYLAAFACVLGRAAHADSHVSDEETSKMLQIVKVLGHLPEAQAVLVVEMAESQVRLFGGTENYVVTRQFKTLSSPQQRFELLECVFAVTAADESITVVEEGQARQISKELGLTHSEFIAARAGYVEHVEALRDFRRQRDGNA